MANIKSQKKRIRQDAKKNLRNKSVKTELKSSLKSLYDENNKIIIDGQLIGELKGLRFNIELTSQTLDTDIKSIKKAARKGIQEELNRRAEEIINKKNILLSLN